MASGEAVAESIEDERLRRLFAYWREKAAGRIGPARRDIDPLEFPYLLGDIALVEVLRNPLRFRYRIMGTRIVKRVTADMTGRFVSDIPTPQLRQATQQAYERVTREGRPLLHRGARVFDGRTFRYEILRLPLSEDGRTVTMILAASLHNEA